MCNNVTISWKSCWITLQKEKFTYAGLNLPEKCLILEQKKVHIFLFSSVILNYFIFFPNEIPWMVVEKNYFGGFVFQIV